MLIIYVFISLYECGNRSVASEKGNLCACGQSGKSRFDRTPENKISVPCIRTKEMTLSMHRKMDRILFPFPAVPILCRKVPRKMQSRKTIVRKFPIHARSQLDDPDVELIIRAVNLFEELSGF